MKSEIPNISRLLPEASARVVEQGYMGYDVLYTALLILCSSLNISFIFPQ